MALVADVELMVHAPPLAIGQGFTTSRSICAMLRMGERPEIGVSRQSFAEIGRLHSSTAVDVCKVCAAAEGFTRVPLRLMLPHYG